MEGNHLASTGEKRAKEVLAREAKIADPEILDISYNDFKQQSPLNIKPTRADAANVPAQFPSGEVKGIDHSLDLGILDGLKKSGFVANLQRKYGQNNALIGIVDPVRRENGFPIGCVSADAGGAGAGGDWGGEGRRRVSTHSGHSLYRRVQKYRALGSAHTRIIVLYSFW